MDGPPTVDRYPIALDKVRFIGEEVAAVAAVDEDTAEEALELIQVDYEPLPAVLDAEEAMKSEAPQLHEHAPGNIYLMPINIEYGDVEKGFQESDYIREDTSEVIPEIHGWIETLVSIASYDSLSKKLESWINTEVPQWIGKSLKLLKVKLAIGGGCGSAVLYRLCISRLHRDVAQTFLWNILKT